MTLPTQFQENYPFITCLKINDTEYIGIIINLDNYVTSIYDLALIKSEADRKLFLDMGEVWWWESNRKIPINIFLKNEMTNFKYSIKTFSTKDITIIFGPVVSLGEIAEKRVKRKSIQLVRSIKSNRS